MSLHNLAFEESFIFQLVIRIAYGKIASKFAAGTRPRVVGKRTPRFPISYSHDKVNREKFFSSARQGLKLKVDASVDDVAHEVALALAEASQKGGSPQVSQTPNRRTRNIMSSPNRNVERMVLFNLY